MSNLNQPSDKSAQRQENNGSKSSMEKAKKMRDRDEKRRSEPSLYEDEGPITLS